MARNILNYAKRQYPAPRGVGLDSLGYGPSLKASKVLEVKGAMMYEESQAIGWLLTACHVYAESTASEIPPGVEKLLEYVISS